MKEVERWVEVPIEYDEIVDITNNTSWAELLAMGTQKYSNALDAEFNNSKMKKYSMVSMKSIFSLGLIPAAEILMHTKKAEEET